MLIRGLPLENSDVIEEKNCTIYNHAPASLLNQLICNAELVISRSGYTTVMDLMKLGKKSILVPTPGQAEQEYLAIHLQQQQLAYTVTQAYTCSLQHWPPQVRSLTKTVNQWKNTKAVIRSVIEEACKCAMEEYKAVIRTGSGLKHINGYIVSVSLMT